ncbi:MAG: shikimate dehydrogenase [Lachnospiraceae bacterium]|nr:shikimate dehydrogenase [Lachnospiraceae bacterium]
MQEIHGKTKVMGLFGHPIGHTFSPLIHNMLAELTGQELVYVPLEVQEEALLGDAVKGAHAMSLQGMNVTVPYKSAVIPFLKEIDPLAERIGAVNTLVPVEDGYKGYNTDHVGLKRALEGHGIRIREHKVVLIGAGGAARAAVYMCASEGVGEMTILNRSVDKAAELAAEVQEHYPDIHIQVMSLDEAGKVPYEKFVAIQCTSVGLAPNTELSPVTDPGFFAKTEAAYDLIYNPEETAFLKKVHEAGAPGWCGMGMLLWQGIAAYELWTEVSVPAEAAEKVDRALQEFLRNKNSGSSAAKSMADTPAAGFSAQAAPAASSAGPSAPVASAAASEGKRGTTLTPLKNLILVGFMGSGKSRISREIAARTGRQCCDMDRLIEQLAGKKITDIFAEEGESGFRDRETRMLHTLLGEGREGRIYAAGGGLIIREENRRLLKQLGTVVRLTAEPETVLKRVGKDTSRPLLQGPDRMQKIRTLMAEREDAYREASDLTIITDEREPSEIAREILERMADLC